MEFTQQRTECGLTLLQKTEEGAGDYSARLCLLCSSVSPPHAGAEAGTRARPPHGFTAWVVSSKASYPQWICFLLRKQIKRGEFKDKPSPIESRERGRSRDPAAVGFWGGSSWHSGASLAFSLEWRVSHAVERFHSNKQILCFWKGSRREDGRLALVVCLCQPDVCFYMKWTPESVVPKTFSKELTFLLFIISLPMAGGCRCPVPWRDINSCRRTS